MLKRTVILKYCLIFFLSMGCSNQDNKRITINFQEKETTISLKQKYTKSLKLAISSMTSPQQTFVHYHELIDYLSKKTGIKILLEQRRTYKEINDLLISGELDFAFICSGAYVELTSKNKTDIIAIPQINGKTTYQAYIITNKQSGINSFSDFRNKSFAFTDLLSNTGRMYVLKKIKEIKETDVKFFTKIIFTNAHDNSIQLVNKGLIDGATVDGLIFENLKLKNPDLVKNIKIIEKSEPYAIPPIVSMLDKRPKLEKIRKVLLNMSEDKKGKEILSKLLIEKFVPGYDSCYNSIRNFYRFINK